MSRLGLIWERSELAIIENMTDEQFEAYRLLKASGIKLCQKPCCV